MTFFSCPPLQSQHRKFRKLDKQLTPNCLIIFFVPVDPTRTCPNGGIGGGCLNDLYTIYVLQLHRLSSEDVDGTITLSPPALTFLQPGLPGIIGPITCQQFLRKVGVHLTGNQHIKRSIYTKMHLKRSIKLASSIAGPAASEDSYKTTMFVNLWQSKLYP